MTQNQQFDADVIAVEPEMPVTFKHQGKDFIGQRTPIAGKLEMQDPGFEQLFDFMMEVRTSQFIAPILAPAEEDIIEIGQVEYRVAGVTTDQAGVVNTYALKQYT